MPTWIRFRFENGDSTLVNAETSYLVFKIEEPRIEVHALAPAQGREGAGPPVCTYPCEDAEQVGAAEELIYEALSNGHSLTITLDALDEQADYMNQVNGIRMVLQLLHQGTIRIPKEDGVSEMELLERDNDAQLSEISQFEDLLYTYLDVPKDAMRRAWRRESEDSPFLLTTDHEACDDHGFHEYWVVATRPDRNYSIRQKYDDLAKKLIEKDGLSWQAG